MNEFSTIVLVGYVDGDPLNQINLGTFRFIEHANRLLEAVVVNYDDERKAWMKSGLTCVRLEATKEFTVPSWNGSRGLRVSFDDRIPCSWRFQTDFHGREGGSCGILAPGCERVFECLQWLRWSPTQAGLE